MSSPAPLEDREAARPVRGPLGRWRRLPGWQRAAGVYGLALLFGVFVLPLLIWVAGNRFLGPYVHGQNPHAGPGALLGDFLLALAHGSAVFWGVALAPAGLILLLSLLTRGLRALPERR